MDKWTFEKSAWGKTQGEALDKVIKKLSIERQKLLDKVNEKQILGGCANCGKPVTKKQSDFHYELQRIEGGYNCFTMGHDFHSFYFCNYTCSEAWKKKKGF